MLSENICMVSKFNGHFRFKFENLTNVFHTKIVGFSNLNFNRPLKIRCALLTPNLKQFNTFRQFNEWNV